jgi:hypothetical protein
MGACESAVTMEDRMALDTSLKIDRAINDSRRR